MAQLILIAGRDNSAQRCTLWKFNPGTGLLSKFHDNPAAAGTSRDTSFKDLHIKDANNIAAVGSMDSTGSKIGVISYLKDGVWHDWDYPLGYYFNSVVIRPNGKLWITANTPTMDGLLELDPDTGILTTARSNTYAWHGIKQYADDGSILVMDNGVNDTSNRHLQLFSGGSWVSWGDSGASHDGFSCFDYLNGALYTANATGGNTSFVRKAISPNNWTSITTSFSSTSLKLSLKVFADDDIYLLHGTNGGTNLQLAHWNGSSWTLKKNFGNWGNSGTTGINRFRWDGVGRAYIYTVRTLDYGRLYWSDDPNLATWSYIDMPYRDGNRAGFEILDAPPTTDWLLGGRDYVGDEVGQPDRGKIVKYSGGVFTTQFQTTEGASDAEDAQISHMVEDRSVIHAVGGGQVATQVWDQARVYAVSEDQGETWNEIELALNAGADLFHQKAIVLSDGTLWTGSATSSGTDKGVLRRDGLDSYTKLLDNTNGRNLTYFADDNIWTSVGATVYQWTGSSWQNRGTAPSSTVPSFFGIIGSTVYMVHPYTIATWAGGTSWNILLSPGGAAQNYVSGYFQDASNIWITGRGVGIPTIWRFNGTTLTAVWEGAPAPDVSGVFDIGRSALDGSFVAVARTGNTTAVLLESFDGLTWIEVAMPAAFLAYSAIPVDYVPDTVPPTVTPVSPTSGQEDIDRSAPVIVDITDNLDQLAPDSVVIWVRGTRVWEDDAATTAYSGSKSAITDGFRYTIYKRDAPWDTHTTHTVQVHAEDLDGNPANVIWSFKTATITSDITERFTLATDYPVSSGNGGVDQSGTGALSMTAPSGADMSWESGVSNGRTTTFPNEYNVNYESVTAEYVITNRTTTDADHSGVIAGFVIDDDNAIYVKSGTGAGTDFVVVQIHEGVKTEIGSYSGTPVTGDAGIKITVLPGTNQVVVEINPDYGADPTAYEPLSPQPLGTAFAGAGVTAADISGIVAVISEPGFTPEQGADIVLMMMGGDPEGVKRVSRDDIASVEDAQTFPAQVGPNLHAHEFSGGQLLPGPAAQQPGSVGPFDNASVADEGQILDTVSNDVARRIPQRAFPQDVVEALLGTQGTYNDTTQDTAGKDHFSEKGLRGAFYYNTAGEAWANPLTSLMTGFARDGTRYTAGVQDGGPVDAAWATEASSAVRGVRDDFPERALVVWTDNAITVFDLTNFPADLVMWMRFTASATTLVRTAITDIKMLNGVMCVATTFPGQGLILVDFKGDAIANIAHFIRSDTHLLWNGTIVQRNGADQYTTSGVSPSLRIDSEENHSLAAYKEAARYLVAVAGEDNTHVIDVDDSLGSVPQRSSPTAEFVRPIDVGNIRNALVDEFGWLWHSEQTRLMRNAMPWKGGMIVQENRSNKFARGTNPHWPEVVLPAEITQLAAARDYVYCGTAQGIYRVKRGTLQVELAYTVVGGGGGGRLANPPDGEVLLGDTPQVLWLAAYSIDTSSYLSVATYQGVVTIRLYDDHVTQGLVYPALYEHRARFNTSIIS